MKNKRPASPALVSALRREYSLIVEREALLSIKLKNDRDGTVKSRLSSGYPPNCKPFTL